MPSPFDAGIAYCPFPMVAQAALCCPSAMGTKLIVASSSGDPSSVILPLTVAPAPGPHPVSDARQASDNTTPSATQPRKDMFHPSSKLVGR
jgi:hypothetical protein